VLVSVITAARDAQATLGATLASLRAQTHGEWEAIVVDDGSRDATAGLAASAAAQDARVRTASGGGAGVGAARNLGISLARGEALLFLDADDLLAPRHLELLTGALARDAEAVAAHCGWARVAADGSRLEFPAPDARDLFPLLARYCPFAIHACLVRRDAVAAVSGFDETLPVCEDWDLWQRVARLGGFARVEEVLALYLTRPGSASVDGRRFLEHALPVVERGHAPDPRVPSGRLHAHGAPPEGLPEARLLVLAWAAGLELGAGRDPRPLLVHAAGRPAPDLSPVGVADSLLTSVPVPTAAAWEAWPGLLARSGEAIREFLAGLEQASCATLLARRVTRLLERRVAALLPGEGCVGARAVASVDADAPLRDLELEPGVELLEVRVSYGGEPAGSLELPVLAGRVEAAALAEAIADRLGWTLLRRFLEHTLLAEVECRDGPAGASLWRNGACLAASLEPGLPRSGWADAAGWSLFVQELWGLPHWPAAEIWDGRAPVPTFAGPDAPVEVALPLPALVGAGPRTVPVSLGGRPLLELPLVLDGRLAPERLRAAINRAAGPDLLRHAAREALVGRPLEGPRLRERLATASASGAALGPATVPAPLAGCRTPPEPDPGRSRRGGRGEFEALFAAGADPWRYTTPYEVAKYEQTLALVPPGTERALELACAEGHFTERLAARAGAVLAADISAIALERAKARCAGLANVEFTRLDLVEDALPGGFDAVVCSEVLYYVGDLDVLDVVARKLAGALRPGGALVTAHANVLADDPASPGFDWGLPFGALTIGRVLGRHLELEEEIRCPLYRVQRFRRPDGRPAARPVRVSQVPLPPLTPEVAAHARLAGGRPRVVEAPPARTDRLPVLMYHQVAAAGPRALARYRVDPAALDEQLAYLRDAGYRSASPLEWLCAMRSRRPLPGRRVLLTFDDGYRSFAEEALPLLERYGFSATVFVVAGAAGRTAAWDGAAGARLPLLSWDEIEGVRRRGVAVGSHALTHRPLTALRPEDALEELVRSRALLAERTGGEVAELAYPHGEVDDAVEELARRAGYLAGFTCAPGPSGYFDRPLRLPRIEIQGSTRLADLVLELPT
jgi:peptidoglycan/xylan/chitin deacetylase (PgdA/CDA1 family)/SAM-dependent methyltransferase/GT2 family glycosyltransferase